MAVEARHLSLFPPQINNRELVMNGVEAHGFGTRMCFPTTATENMFPAYGSSIADKLPAMKSDSGLTFIPVSRKRSRDSANYMLSSSVQCQNTNNRCGSFAFLGEDISSQIQQQQLDIDLFIAHHTEKVRMEIEERRKRYCRRITAAFEETATKKLKAKDDELDRIGKLNWSLEEKVKSLSMENEIWRDLAQTNEATANALRCNLEQLLTQRRRVDAADDSQSSCGSNSDETHRSPLTDSTSNYTGINGGPSVEKKSSKMCRKCGKEESRVLILPCRHLCLCTSCGSSLHICPVCNSTKTASLHVNLSL